MNGREEVDKTIVYATGPWIGAYVNGQVRIAAAYYDTDFTPGPKDGTTNKRGI